MAVLSDIATVTASSNTFTVIGNIAALTVTVVDAASVGMVGVPIPAPFSVLQVTVPGPQGPKGDQNVYVSTTAPSSPQVGWIWVKI